MFFVIIPCVERGCKFIDLLFLSFALSIDKDRAEKRDLKWFLLIFKTIFFTNSISIGSFLCGEFDFIFFGFKNL